VQVEHVPEAVAPNVDEYIPALQLVQNEKLEDAWYVPAAQSEQL
jgi:hypothetical protein